MLRRSLALALAVALLAAGSAAARKRATGGGTSAVCAASCYAAPAGSGALFVFSGHGWGHGVGMSQWGAYGYAQHGWTAGQILAHYYPGTTLGRTKLTSVRVLLADGRKTLSISSSAPFTVVDGTGASHTLAAGTVRFDTGLALPVDGRATAQALTPPLEFAPADGATLALGRAYHGQILVDVVDGRLRAIDVVSLEQYLDGVVPAEMPSTWPAAALQAQAVVARSYALATRRVAAPFDLYADGRSQVYLGAGQESASTTAAVAATAGQVLLYDGKVATTYFSSSSGGETESSVDVWGGNPVPYLVPVPDPYDVLSPYHDWGPVPVTAKKLAQTLHVTGTVLDATTTPNPAGRVATLDVLSRPAASPQPLETTVAATTVQARLGLRSTWFDVGVLSLAPLEPPLAPIPYGSSIGLAGVIRGVDGVALEVRPAASSWQDAGTLQPDGQGEIELLETPTITTDYRLATPDAAAAYVRVRVTPRVKLSEPLGGDAVAGSEQPVLSGAPVRVERQNADGTTWTTVAQGTVDANGDFSVPAQLEPGTYRAVVTPGRGYWPGASAPATVAG